MCRHVHSRCSRLGCREQRACKLDLLARARRRRRRRCSTGWCENLSGRSMGSRRMTPCQLFDEARNTSYPPLVNMSIFNDRWWEMSGEGGRTEVS